MRLILSGTGAILLDFWPEIGATPRLYLATRLFEPIWLYLQITLFEPNCYISRSDCSKLI